MNFSTPVESQDRQPRPWVSREAAYLHFVSFPEGFAMVLCNVRGVRDPKLRWILQQRGKMARAIIANAGRATEMAQAARRALSCRFATDTTVADEVIDMSQGLRDEQRVIREFAALPVYLRALSAGWRTFMHVRMSPPFIDPGSVEAPEGELGTVRVEISTRELPRLLKLAQKHLDAVLPPEAELEHPRARLRICSMPDCDVVFVKTQHAQKYCPACRERWKKQQLWYRAGGKRYRPKKAQPRP